MKYWFLTLLSLIIVSISAVSVWLVRAYLPIVGLVWVGAIGLAPILLLAIGVVFFIQLLTHVEYGDIGPSGTWFRSITGHTTFAAPMLAASPKEKPTVTVVEIPTVAELLEKNLLGTTDLLLGFNQSDGKPHWGSWDNVRTFCIAGKGRSGKTITMFFLIIQALLSGATVWVCDPHAKKKSSITALLRPLAPWVRFAYTDVEIAGLVDEFIDTMERRVSGESQDETPQLLVVDEFTRMVEDNEKIYHAVVACAQQYAGFLGFSIIAGHEWTGNGKMLAKLRRAVHAKFVHRLDEGYAKYLLNSSKFARTAEKLRTGYCYLQDAEGDIHELRTPLGVAQDALTVAERMQLLPVPVDVSQVGRNPVSLSLSPVDLRLLGQGRSENGESMKQPMKPGEGFTERSESKEVSQENREAIFRAVDALSSENKAVTREAIKAFLGWNNKQHWIVKAVCDEYGIACKE
jgi:hypothetical protein